MKVLESLLIDAGITPLAGVDEAGRGACAGPLVIASVVLADPFAPELSQVRDSKDVSESEREKLFDVVTSAALAVSVIVVPAAEVDQRGVHAANLDGMRRAVQGLAITPSYVLTDGYAIAKVTRDRIMRELDLQFPDYGFSKHKGYITKVHTEALQAHGPCIEHRRSFSNIATLLQ
jgi:ribonuclease HII